MSNWGIFWVGLFGCKALAITVNFVANSWRAHQRTKRIAAHGWPPAHIDADGDAVAEEDEA